jgi:hypothetical protein
MSFKKTAELELWEYRSTPTLMCRLIATPNTTFFKLRENFHTSWRMLNAHINYLRSRPHILTYKRGLSKVNIMAI